MIKQKIQADQIQAMKAHDTVRLDTLRYILSQIKNVEIDSQKELNDDEIINLIRKEVKKLTDSMISFKEGNREDLASEYEAQKNILAAYLPQELSDDDLKAEVQKVIEKNKDLFEKNPNAAIGICIKELKSKAESSRIAAIVKSL